MSTSLVLKLGMAVPKWVRVRSTNSNPITTSPLHFHNSSLSSPSSPSPSVSLSSAINTNKNTKKHNSTENHRLSLSLSPPSSLSSSSSIGWERRIAPCAPPAHDKCARFSSSDLTAHSSSSSSSSSSSETVMGWESKDLRGKEADHQQDQKQRQSSKFLTLPTVLTLGRVAAVPLLVATFYVDSWWGTTATTSIFIAAAITDWLDGYLARKMRLGSAFGAFLDPVADKLMVAATLVLLCTKPLDLGVFGQASWLLTVPAIAIIGREITMSAVREWAASQNTKLLEAVAVNNLGKWKTATQMTALTILLATRDSSLGGPGFLVASGVVLLYISAGLAVWSLAVYMSKIWRVLLK